MDFKGQKTGGINSNGTNLVPDSDFSAPQNSPQTMSGTANDSSSLQPSNVNPPQQFSAQKTTPVTSNGYNTNDNVVPKTSVDIAAEDSDLIEKEWVIKAKSIVENTQNNPFLQSQKLAELRTEYLQKRYGKSLQEDA